MFFIDHLDAFYEDTRAGLAVAYFISELQQQVRRELTVLSLNEDVWESTFRSGLPSAFELTEALREDVAAADHVIDLGPEGGDDDRAPIRERDRSR